MAITDETKLEIALALVARGAKSGTIGFQPLVGGTVRVFVDGVQYGLWHVKQGSFLYTVKSAKSDKSKTA